MAERLWSGVAQAYARSFAGLCAGAVPALLDGVPAGTRLLDVGCGTGLLAEDAVRRGARVSACDLDADMVALAAERLGDEVVPTVAGLPHLPYPDASHDVVTACFVLNHVDDPAASAAELVRVCAPGGSVRASVWGTGETAQGRLFKAVMVAAGAVDPQLAPLPPAADFERSVDGLVGLLRDAGCREAEGRTLSWEWRVRPDDFWAGPSGGVAGVGAVWRAQVPAVRERMRVEFDRLRVPLMDGEHLVLPASAVVVHARR